MMDPSSTSAPVIRLPRQAVLASAGTGKTYTLSSRALGLLAHGAPPDSLLASTFTRKAAGEILNRVLTRLAMAVLDPHRAAILVQEVSLGPRDESAQDRPQEFCAALLRALVDDLHRVNVGTLDSLFVRIARSFSNDLGMPPDWGVSGEPVLRRMETEALQEVLASADPVERAELIRMTLRGEASRGVHRRLLNQLQELRGIRHQMGADDSADLWGPPGSSPLESGLESLEGESLEEICRRLESATLPLTARGEPHGHFQRAVADGVASLRARDWEGFCRKGLASKILSGTSEFYRVTIPDELTAETRRALGWVARALRAELASQARALHSLVREFDDALNEIQRRDGEYGFQDITYLLAGMGEIAHRSDLWYRLDQQARHLLLDEFQDTSRAQWTAMEPMVEDLLSRDRERSSVLVVADPKQSIYGWRGAEPSLTREVANRFELDVGTLEKSYRSSGRVLSFVNRVFDRLDENPVWDQRPELLQAVREWGSAFRPHRPANKLPGFVAVEVGPREDEARGSDRPALMQWTAERIRSLHHACPGASLGILVRRNATVTRLMASLRALGVEASEEGASTLSDSAAVSTALALLTLSDHPGDRLALYQVTHSPLREVLGVSWDAPDAGIRRRLLGLRRGLLARGYGRTLNGWLDGLRGAGVLDGRELARFTQLVELAYRWDGHRTLRPRDFVRFVETEAVEAPKEARVRVMTVHKAKGLEFDRVVLPELHLSLTTGRGIHKSVLPMRDPATGAILKVFPHLNQNLRALFPEMEEAHAQDVAREVVDALGVVYVALTRAKHALHLVVEADPPDRDPEPSLTPAGLIRCALANGDLRRAEPGVPIFEEGREDWWKDLPSLGSFPSRRSPRPRPEGTVPDLGGREAARKRFLPHRTPSSMEDTIPGAVARALSLERTRGRRFGSVIHRWLEAIVWYDDWPLDLDQLLNMGREVVPDLGRAETRAWAEKLTEWLSAGEIRGKLDGSAYPSGTEVLNETPFVFRMEDSLINGRIDRLVLIPEGDGLSSVEVLDYKTDAIPSVDPGAVQGVVEGYREQMRVYRAAASELYGVSLKRVRGALVLLSAGRVVTF